MQPTRVKRVLYALALGALFAFLAVMTDVPSSDSTPNGTSATAPSHPR